MYQRRTAATPNLANVIVKYGKPIASTATTCKMKLRHVLLLRIMWKLTKRQTAAAAKILVFQTMKFVIRGFNALQAVKT